ncbi:MAG TPA: hypothetical protein VL486_08075 [Verrucomicrobiae bacterium]|nr:hypothetical protein [Verrucomicrobiae bacterium]
MNALMKKLLLVGGLLGFGIGIGFGLIQGESLPTALLQASVALYAGALLMRWWGRAWIQALEESRRGRRRE